MQGYRTIIFNIVMLTVGMLGWKVSPDVTNHWLDVFFAAWAIGAILLRLITTTPIGATVNSEIAALTDRVHFLISRGPSSGDITELAGAVRDLFGKLEDDPQIGEHNIEIIRKLDALLVMLQGAAPAAIAMAEKILSPETPAPDATPAAEAAVSAPAADDAPVIPSPAAVPAQPSSSVEAAFERTIATAAPSLIPVF